MCIRDSFEVAIFNRSFAADELENEELYLKRKMAVSSMLNTNYGSNAEYISIQQIIILLKSLMIHGKKIMKSL